MGWFNSKKKDDAIKKKDTIIYNIEDSKKQEYKVEEELRREHKAVRTALKRFNHGVKKVPRLMTKGVEKGLDSEGALQEYDIDGIYDAGKALIEEVASMLSGTVSTGNKALEYFLAAESAVGSANIDRKLKKEFEEVKSKEIAELQSLKSLAGTADTIGRDIINHFMNKELIKLSGLFLQLHNLSVEKHRLEDENQNTSAVEKQLNELDDELKKPLKDFDKAADKIRNDLEALEKEVGKNCRTITKVEKVLKKMESQEEDVLKENLKKAQKIALEKVPDYKGGHI